MNTALFAHHRFKIALVTLILGTLLSTTFVSAHFFGGRFPHTAGSWLYLPYTQWGAYRTPVLNATYSWYARPNRLIPYETANYYISKEDYYSVYVNDTWWGYTVLHPCYGSGCSYIWADLYLNTRTLGGEADFMRQKVAAHEFGHGIGLAHTIDWWYPSIMKQGYLSYNTPQAHDDSDTNALYP